MICVFCVCVLAWHIHIAWKLVMSGPAHTHWYRFPSHIITTDWKNNNNARGDTTKNKRLGMGFYRLSAVATLHKCSILTNVGGPHQCRIRSVRLSRNLEKKITQIKTHTTVSGDWSEQDVGKMKKSIQELDSSVHYHCSPSFAIFHPPGMTRYIDRKMSKTWLTCRHKRENSARHGSEFVQWVWKKLS